MECRTLLNPSDRPVEPILATFDAWEKAVHSGDLDAITALVSEDAEFWTAAQPPLRGRKALRAAMAPLLDDWVLDQTFACDELMVADGLAVARGVELNHLAPRGAGKPIVQRQRAFSVLVEESDGVWRFARGMTTPLPENEQ